MCAAAGWRPAAVVKGRRKKIDLGRGRIVGLHKLRRISDGAALGIGGMAVRQKPLVAPPHRFTVQHKVTKQTVAVVTADPDAVDQPLIKRMYRQYIFAGMQLTGNIHDKIAEPIGIRRCGSLRDKATVDIGLVVVVRRNVQQRRLRQAVERKMPPKQNMAVTMLVAGQIHSLKLAVKHLPRRKLCKFLVCDPHAGKNMVYHTAYTPSVYRLIS